MKLRTRTAAAAFIVAGLGVGGAGIAVASGGTSSPAQSSAVGASAADSTDTVDDEGDGATDEADVGEQDPSFTGSIAAPTEGSNGTAEADEAASLQALATLTSAEATAAALAAVPGTAGDVELGNENGFVVYSVEVTGGSGVTDVKVDAGNGAVLSQETGEAPGTEDPND